MKSSWENAARKNCVSSLNNLVVPSPHIEIPGKASRHHHTNTSGYSPGGWNKWKKKSSLPPTASAAGGMPRSHGRCALLCGGKGCCSSFSVMDKIRIVFSVASPWSAGISLCSLFCTTINKDYLLVPYSFALLCCITCTLLMKATDLLFLSRLHLYASTLCQLHYDHTATDVLVFKFKGTLFIP